SANDEPDADGAGRSDRPYRLTSVFGHFRGNLTAADLFSRGFAAAAVAAAERTFPVLQPVAVADESPLARPPRLSAVPASDGRRTRAAGSGLLASAALLGAGVLVATHGRRARA